jgi:hypothetical protein
MSITNDMRRIAANRRMNNEFNELTRNINMPNVPANKLYRQTINKIDTFLKSVNGNPLQNEKLIFDNNITGTYQLKFTKENARELMFDTSRYRRNLFKELFYQKTRNDLLDQAHRTSMEIGHFKSDNSALENDVLTQLNNITEHIKYSNAQIQNLQQQNTQLGDENNEPSVLAVQT